MPEILRDLWLGACAIFLFLGAPVLVASATIRLLDRLEDRLLGLVVSILFFCVMVALIAAVINNVVRFA